MTALIYDRVKHNRSFAIGNRSWISENADQHYSLLRARNHHALFHHRLRPGDPLPRAEIRQYDTFGFGEEHWFSVQHFLRPQDVTSANVILQCHNTWDAGDQSDNPPPFKITVDPDNSLRITTCFDANATTVGVVPQTTRLLLPPGEYALSKWHHWLVRASFTPTTATGLLDVYLDGDPSPVVSLRNLQMGYNDTQGVYWKCGVYDYDINAEVEAYVANPEVSMDSLFGRLDGPRPVPNIV